MIHVAGDDPLSTRSFGTLSTLLFLAALPKERGVERPTEGGETGQEKPVLRAQKPGSFVLANHRTSFPSRRS